MTTNITPKSVWSQIWHHLSTATESGNHPFSTPVVANTHTDGLPRMRVVVLRKVDERQASFYFYTDRRSIKADFKEDRRFSFLFWDPDRKLQLRAGGIGSWLDEQSARHIYDQLPKHSRKAYATRLPPSSSQATLDSGLPEDWEKLSKEETAYARSNFGVIVTSIDRAEVLKLDRSGNSRFTATRAADDRWSFQPIVP